MARRTGLRRTNRKNLRKSMRKGMKHRKNTMRRRNTNRKVRRNTMRRRNTNRKVRRNSRRNFRWMRGGAEAAAAAGPRMLLPVAQPVDLDRRMFEEMVEKVKAEVSGMDDQGKLIERAKGEGASEEEITDKLAGVKKTLTNQAAKDEKPLPTEEKLTEEYNKALKDMIIFLHATAAGKVGRNQTVDGNEPVKLAKIRDITYNEVTYGVYPFLHTSLLPPVIQDFLNDKLKDAVDDFIKEAVDQGKVVPPGSGEGDHIIIMGPPGKPTQQTYKATAMLLNPHKQCSIYNAHPHIFLNLNDMMNVAPVYGNYEGRTQTLFTEEGDKNLGETS